MSPVTEADFRIQRTIEYCLTRLYPGLSVKGEEDPKNYMKYEPQVKEDQLRRARVGDPPLKWCDWQALKGKHKERKEVLKKIKEAQPDT